MSQERPSPPGCYCSMKEYTNAAGSQCLTADAAQRTLNMSTCRGFSPNTYLDAIWKEVRTMQDACAGLSWARALQRSE